MLKITRFWLRSQAFACSFEIAIFDSCQIGFIVFGRRACCFGLTRELQRNVFVAFAFLPNGIYGHECDQSEDEKCWLQQEWSRENAYDFQEKLTSQTRKKGPSPG